MNDSVALICKCPSNCVCTADVGECLADGGTPYEPRSRKMETVYLAPQIRVEALILDTLQGSRRALLMHHVATGSRFLPGGRLYTDCTPLQALKTHLLRQLSLAAYMVAEYRLIAVDSDIRPDVPKTRLNLVYLITTISPVLGLVKVEAHHEAQLLSYSEMNKALLDSNAPFVAARATAAFNAAKFNNPALNLLCGKNV